MAKKLKLKVPKRVAGVKIPKSVRKGPIGQFLNSRGGQIIIAEALVAAAGALTVSKSDESSGVGELVRHPVEGSRRIGRRAARAGADQTARLSYALREASRAFRIAMESGPGEEGWQQAQAEAEAEPTEKKKHSSRAERGAPH